MEFESPRVHARSPESPQETARLARRVRLLALAGALDDVGMRARLVEYVLRPTLLRCWDPRVMGLTLLVVCEPSDGAHFWEFRFHPGSQAFADAENVTQPDRAIAAARILADALTTRG